MIFVFYKIPLPSTLLPSPCPTAVPVSLKTILQCDEEAYNIEFCTNLGH